MKAAEKKMRENKSNRYGSSSTQLLIQSLQTRFEKKKSVIRISHQGRQASLERRRRRWGQRLQVSECNNSNQQKGQQVMMEFFGKRNMGHGLNMTAFILHEKNADAWSGLVEFSLERQTNTVALIHSTNIEQHSESRFRLRANPENLSGEP